MLSALYAALSLSIIYRIAINLPELTYTADLQSIGSKDFLRTSRAIAQAVERLLIDLPTHHNASVIQYRYHKDLGTLVYLDVYSDRKSSKVKARFQKAIEDGYLGPFRVSGDGFEIHLIRDINSNCIATDFQCADGSCISAKLRCDKKEDCLDGSDEQSAYARCDRASTPIVYQTNRVIYAPRGGVALLSAIIDQIPKDHQILWSHGGQLIADGSLVTAGDSRINVYSAASEYFLRIENVTNADTGEYTISVGGMGVDATFELRVTSDEVKAPSKGCPERERLCRSGHCLPISQFCDRVVQCPDGDDEENCTPISCSTSEFRCTSSNACVPIVVRCDGWKDCHDGTDEMNCTTAKPSPHHIHPIHRYHRSRVMVVCEDGSMPEVSLHGSSYCWSDFVCPTGTSCLQGLCCRSGKTGKRSISHCGEGEYQCDNGQCIDKENHCDRNYDCTDGSDEMKCDGRQVQPAMAFLCASTDEQ